MNANRASATCDQPKRIMGFLLAGLYTMTAKAAMLLAVLGHFWFLRGFARLLRGNLWRQVMTMDRTAENGLLNTNRRRGTRICKPAICIGLGRRTHQERRSMSTLLMKSARTSFRAIIALLFLPLCPALAVSWQQATPAAPWTARQGHECLAYDGKLWVLGGLAPWPTSVNDVWSSGNGTNWTQVTPHAAWSERYEFSCAVFLGKIWLLGGGILEAAPFSDVWCSTDGANWTQATANAPWGPRQAHACAVFQNKLWLLGGNSGSQDLNDVWSTGDGTNWTRVTSSAPWSPRIEPPGSGA